MAAIVDLAVEEGHEKSPGDIGGELQRLSSGKQSRLPYHGGLLGDTGKFPRFCTQCIIDRDRSSHGHLMRQQ
jgi:hypothetical protein